MAENSPPPNPNPNSSKEDEVARLAASARDVELNPLPAARPTADNAFWRLIDRAGRYAVPVALVSVILGFGLVLLGFEWANWLFLLTTLALLIYVPALVRANARAREEALRVARERQEQARAQVARIVLEQSRREGNNNSPQRTQRDTED